MWPARGGPVVHDGIVYFAASIWPMMGTFIYALDAVTGDVVWLNDGNGSEFMLQPHRAYSFAGVAPQGALAVSGDKLLVSGGRSVPAVFDRHTGKLLYYELSVNNKTGGSFVSASGDVFFNHTREKFTTMYHLQTGVALVPNIGQYPVLTDKAWYFSGDTVTVYKAGWIKDSLNEWATESPISTGELRNLATQKSRVNKRRELDVDASGDLIKAGVCLYAAGDGSITAIDIAKSKYKPSVNWVKAVDGKVERLLAADNKLFAVTLDGRIMAFGGKKSKPRRILDRPVSAEHSIETTRKARYILEKTGVTEGYALFYGAGDGDLLEALVSNSKLSVIAVDPDEDTVLKLRQRFNANGLYGSRISVHTGDPLTFSVPQYIASLTIINEPEFAGGRQDELFIKRIFNSMRPYGGTAWLPIKGKQQADFVILADKSGLHGARTETSEDFVLLLRDGPLPGAGIWTHNYGNIANTTKSDDELVRLPLGLLWFGGNSNLDVLPRHGHGPAEQVVGGRLFIEGMDCLSARDVYTGRVIWKVMLHDMENYGVYFDHTYKDTPLSTRYNQVHIPGANIRGTNYIATSDRVYVLQGSRCNVLDAATGKNLDVFSLPPLDPEAERPQSPPWGYIGVYGDKLIAGYGFVTFSDLLQKKKADYAANEDFDRSASKGLIVMDRFSGEILWRIDALNGFLHNGIAAGKNMLFCLDKLPVYIEEQLERRGKPIPETYRLLALDISTGNILWEKHDAVFGSFLSYSEERDILLQSARPSRDTVKGETGKRIITYKGRDGTIIWDKPVEYRTFPILHGDRIITESGVLSLMTGESVNRIDPLTGEKIPWTWKRNYGCNYPIASEHLLTFRSGAAGFYDFTNAGGTGNFGGFKSGCTNNMVAADGVLNIPDYTRTCSCSYQNQTSLALVYMPDADIETWTFNPVKWSGEPVKRAGINFGAPGDLLAGDGTLWLDYPSVGGESPDIPVSTSPDEPEWFRFHSSRINGDNHKWVAASGGKGLRSVKITLSKEPVKARRYTVKLYFAEPENIQRGERIFDVNIQGKRRLKRFDIVKETGKSLTLLVKEFTNIAIDSELVIDFIPVDTSGRLPVISGIEVVDEGNN